MLSSDIYSTVDVNHILNLEKLVLALGSRLKAIHIFDGNGVHECHYKGLRHLAPCYNFMYNKYILKAYIQPEYAK